MGWKVSKAVLCVNKILFQLRSNILRSNILDTHDSFPYPHAMQKQILIDPMWKAVEKMLILFTLLTLALSGCGGGSSAPVADAGAIQLNNFSSATIDRIYLAPVDNASLGSDIFMDLLYPNAVLPMQNISPDSYDAKIGVNGRYSDYFAYAYDIPVEAGNTVTLNIHDDSFTGSLEICNKTLAAKNIIGIYLVPADASSWGENQISSVIGPSGVIHLYDLDPGVYKVKVVREDLSESIYDGVNGITIDSLTLTTLDV